MAVNATPQYEKAEERYRKATDPAEQLDALREMLREIPKHKSSEKLQAQIKTKISVLRKELSQDRPGVKRVDPYNIPHSGAGQVVLVGLPNTGKSAVLATVTNAPVKVTEYPYATTAPVPGMWLWEDLAIQLVDTPPISAEHVDGQLISLLHRCDAVLLTVDAASPDNLDQAESALAALSQRQIELFDGPEEAIPPDKPNARPGMLLATHADRAGAEEIQTLGELYAGQLELCAVASPDQTGFDELGRQIWRLLNVVRVYTKRPGQKMELRDPFALPTGSTVEDLALAIHRDLPEKLKFARIWGPGRHEGQQVHRTEVLHDRDVVELHE